MIQSFAPLPGTAPDASAISAFLLSWNGVCFAMGFLLLCFVVYCGIRWTIEDRKKEREALKKLAVDGHGDVHEYMERK